jgi:repressor LexA
MSNKSVFARNLQYQMDLNQKTRKDVCEALGFSYYTFSDWVNGKKMPRMDKVEQLSIYFGCSKSDLIEQKKETATQGSGLSESKKQLLALAESCSEEDAEKLLQMMQILLGKK